MAKLTPRQADRQNEAKAAETARQRAAADRQRATQTNTTNANKATTALGIVQQANTFNPGIPASLVKPSSLLSATGRSDGPRGVGGQNNNTGGGNNGGNVNSNPLAQTTPITAAPVAASSVADPPAAIPPAPQPDVVATPAPVVKSAPIDTVEFIDETLSDERIIELLFEDVGGQELLTIARNDTVNGQNVIYQPFKNLGILQETYNPTNLLRLQQTSDKFFSNFTISLRDKIPNIGSGENGENYKLDPVTGEGIIEFINIRSDEQIEVQILSAGIIEDIDLTESTES